MAESTYSDLIYTNYPVAEDTHRRMTDVDATTVEYVKLFEFYYQQGNQPACKTLLIEHPELDACMFDAEKYNWMRDAIIALQRYYINNVNINLTQVKNYINQTSNGNLSWKFNLDYEVSNTFLANQEEQTKDDNTPDDTDPSGQD